MGCCSGPQKIPDPAVAATAGIQADTELQPFNYLIQAASTLGVPITIDGKTYDFSGLGQADTAGKVSDQMAQTLLALQTEKAPQMIQQRIDELKAADPQGYAARKELFDRITADAQANPDRPVSQDLQDSLQTELAKGAGFDDARQEQQVRDQTRAGQIKSGIYLGAAPSAQESSDVVNAGESLQSQRQQNALAMLQSGTSPEDIAYRRFQQSLGNLANFTAGQTPTAEFGQVSGAAHGPVQLYGGAPTAGFNPNAGASGLNNALSIYGSQLGYQASQSNPWLAGLSTGATGFGAAYKAQPGWFGGGGGQAASAQPGYNNWNSSNGWGY